MIYADDRVVVVCPFWSAVPYEMLVIPREHNPHLHRSPTEDLVAVGEAIRRSLQQLAESVGDVAYNIVFHSAPYRVGEPYHWHAHIWPKATTTAGFELGHRRGHQRDLARGGGRDPQGLRPGGLSRGLDRPARSGPAPGRTPAAAPGPGRARPAPRCPAVPR